MHPLKLQALLTFSLECWQQPGEKVGGKNLTGKGTGTIFAILHSRLKQKKQGALAATKKTKIEVQQPNAITDKPLKFLELPRQKFNSKKPQVP